MKLNTSDKMLKEPAQSAITVLAERYQNIQTIKEENFTVGKQKFRRVDTEQTVNGQKVVSTLVLTVFNKRVVTLQMLSPAKTRGSGTVRWCSGLSIPRGEGGRAPRPDEAEENG